MSAQITHAELELSLSRQDQRVSIEMRFSQGGEAAPPSLQKIPTNINFENLLSYSFDPHTYGKTLTEQLLSSREAQDYFLQVRTIAHRENVPLRIRLRLNEASLHNIKWECMYDPVTQTPLAFDTQLVFSRYLEGSDWRTIALRPYNNLRALVAVAAPTNLDAYELAPLDAHTELTRARNALSGIELDELPAFDARCTLANISLRLAEKPGYDLLYIIAHGVFSEGKAWLCLEDDFGNTQFVAGSVFADVLRDLKEQPRLVVLATCESAGNTYDKALAALGPLIARAGVPVVLAMQGKIQQTTAAQFMHTFFRELHQDGFADRAMAVARRQIQSSPDWGTPVLYSRLYQGRIWLPRPRGKISRYGGREARLPDVYIERREELARVCEQLLAQHSSHTNAPPIVLHGMGGIGKSILARAVCNEDNVQLAFPDGIFWITLGQEPELVPSLRQMVNDLGGTVTDNAPTPQSLRAQLIGLMEDRACLVVADDLWSKNVAELLRLGGPKCKLLITTRDRDLLEDMKAVIQSVPVMTEDQSLVLLQQWSQGALTETHREVLVTIIKRLGSLPLALKLAGSQLQRTDPEQWLKDFDVRELRTRRLEARHDSLERTFELSFALLSDEERKLYRALSIFRQNTSTSEKIINRLWHILSGISPRNTSRLLDDLAARALIELHGNQNVRSISIHGLLHEMMSVELDSDRASVHQTFLSTYQTSTKNWFEVEDDGYIYDHLVYHLDRSGRYTELISTVSNQQWMQNRLQQRHFLYDGYVDDLERALDTAWDCSIREVLTGISPISMSFVLCLMMIRTSINSLANNYETDLIARALETGLWPFERVESLAKRIRGYRRTEIDVLLRRYSNKQLDLPVNLEHIIKSTKHQSAQLAKRQSAQPAKKILEIIDHEQEDVRREAVVQHLSMLLSLYDREYILEAMLIELEKGMSRVQKTRLLLDLLPILPLSLHNHAYNIIGNITGLPGDGQIRAFALHALIPLTTGSFQAALIAKALEDAQEGPETPLSAYATTLIADFLPEEQRDALVVNFADLASNAFSPNSTLLWKDLLPLLPRSAVEQALLLSNKLDDLPEVARLLKSLARTAAQEDALLIYSEMLQLASRAVAKTQSLILRELLPELPESMYSEAEVFARAIRDPASRAEALHSIAHVMQGRRGLSLYIEAKQAAQDVQSPVARAALGVLLMEPPTQKKPLPRDLLAAISDTTTLSEPKARAAEIVRLAQYLPLAQVSAALPAALDIPKLVYRAQAVSALAQKLPLERRLVVLNKLFDDASVAKGNREYTMVLQSISAVAPPLLVEKIMRATHLINDPYEQASILVSLMSNRHLEHSARAECLQHMRTFLGQNLELTRDNMLELLAKYNLLAGISVNANISLSAASKIIEIYESWQWL